MYIYIVEKLYLKAYIYFKKYLKNKNNILIIVSKPPDPCEMNKNTKQNPHHYESI